MNPTEKVFLNLVRSVRHSFHWIIPNDMQDDECVYRQQRQEYRIPEIRLRMPFYAQHPEVLQALQTFWVQRNCAVLRVTEPFCAHSLIYYQTNRHLE